MSRGTDARPRTRVAIIGCGGFARLYHVPALLLDPRVSVTMICDPSPNDEVRRAARRTGAALTDRLDDLWRGSACEAVLVSSPHALHAEHVRAALAAGKHILVDKPFVLKSREATELASAAADRNLVGAVAFNRRFDPGCRRSREIVQAGGVGPIRYVEAVQLGYPAQGWVVDPLLGGGGPFVGRGAHMADLVPWLLDRRPSRVRARILPGDSGRVDLGGVIELGFEGMTCHMTVLAQGLDTWDELRVFGDVGCIELRRPIGRPLGWEMTHRGSRGEPRETIPADDAGGLATTNFLDALEGRAAPACSFSEAWLSVRIIEAAYDSAQGRGAWIEV